jgi:hypothetical protein
MRLSRLLSKHSTDAANIQESIILIYCSFNLVVGRKILLDIMSDQRAQWFGFKKVGKRRVLFAVQCKYTKCTIQPCLKYYLLVVN